MLNSNYPANKPKLLAATAFPSADAVAPCSQITYAPGVGNLFVRRLTASEESRTLKFLNRRPLENITMLGLIYDHGIESSNHRGVFYGCFSQEKLISVALIGHYVLLGESCEKTATAFARTALAFHEAGICLVLGEDVAAKAFCRVLNELSSRLRAHQAAAQVLLALTTVNEEIRGAENLRLALPAEATEIARMNADAHLELNNIDPAGIDPTGFRERVLARIMKERTWVVRDERGIAFKADIVSVAEDVLYLEGIFTRMDVRGTGIGRAALGDLCRRLLRQHKAISLFADAGNERTLSFYQRIGFEPVNSYHLVHYKSIND